MSVDLSGYQPAGSYLTSVPIGGTAIGGVKNGGNVTIDGTGNMNVTFPDTSQFITETEADSKYQPIGSYLTSIPIGGTSIGGVKNGGNVTIETDGTMNTSASGKTVFTGDVSEVMYVMIDRIMVTQDITIVLCGRPGDITYTFVPILEGEYYGGISTVYIVNNNVARIYMDGDGDFHIRTASSSSSFTDATQNKSDSGYLSPGEYRIYLG